MRIIEVEIPDDSGLLKNDEGELNIRIGIENKTVIIHFGKPIVWIGLEVEDVHALANLLLEKAAELKSRE